MFRTLLIVLFLATASFAVMPDLSEYEKGAVIIHYKSMALTRSTHSFIYDNGRMVQVAILDFDRYDVREAWTKPSFVSQLVRDASEIDLSYRKWSVSAVLMIPPPTTTLRFPTVAPPEGIDPNDPSLDSGDGIRKRVEDILERANWKIIQ